MAQNVMTGFMQGYQWADDMQRRQVQDERQSRLDTQAQQDRTRRIGMEDEVLGRQRKEWDDKDASARLSEIAYKIDAGGYEALTDEDREVAGNLVDPLTKKTLERLGKTPESTKEAIGHVDNLLSALSGQGGDYRGAIDSANVLFSDYLDQGQGGTGKKIQDVFPSMSKKGFYLDLGMKDDKGNDKTAPMTRGRGVGENDEVAEIDAAELARALRLQRIALESRQVALGDKTPLERQKERRNALAEEAKEEREFKRKLALKGAEAAVKTERPFGSDALGYYTMDPTSNTARQVVPGLGRAAGGSGFGGGRLPAEAQLIEYYKSQGKTFDEAMALAKQAKENPRVWAAKYYQDLAKADQESVMMYGSEPTPPDELLRQAQDAAAMLFGEQQKRPTGGGMEMMPSHGPGTATGGGRAQAGPVPLDKATALQILQEAGGDKAKARAIALERGFAL